MIIKMKGVKMYLFRALNNMNSGSNSIVAKNQIKNGVVADALKLITTHLQKGSKIENCWISCSKDFNYDVEEFSIPQNKTHNFQRTEISVIDGCQTVDSLREDQLVYLELNVSNLSQVQSANISHLNILLVSSNGIKVSVPINYVYNIDISIVKELVIDFENRNLAKKGVILKKVPEKLVLSNPQYGLSNANKAKEVLFFNQIDPLYIRYTLTPLEIDILYVFSKSKSGSCYFLSILNAIISNNINVTVNLNYNQIYSSLYNDLYSQNKNMHDIAYGLSGKNYDILSVYAQLKKYKRALLLDIIRNINFGSINIKTNIQQMPMNDIKIVEDILDIIAIGKPKNLPNTILSYGGQLPINTGSLPLGSPDSYSNFNDVVLAVNYRNNPVSKGINTNSRLTWLNKSADEEIQRNELIGSTKSEGCSTVRGIDKLKNVII